LQMSSSLATNCSWVSDGAAVVVVVGLVVVVLAVVAALAVVVALVELDDDELPQPASAVTARISAARTTGPRGALMSVMLTRSPSRGPGSRPRTTARGSVCLRLREPTPRDRALGLVVEGGSVSPIPEPDDFMTVADVASILKLNQQTVRNWIDLGEAPRPARRPSGPHPPRRLRRAARGERRQSCAALPDRTSGTARSP
jgi:hypothetical protein